MKEVTVEALQQAEALVEKNLAEKHAYIDKEIKDSNISLDGILSVADALYKQKIDLDWQLSVVCWEPPVFEDGLITYEKMLDDGSIYDYLEEFGYDWVDEQCPSDSYYLYMSQFCEENNIPYDEEAGASAIELPESEMDKFFIEYVVKNHFQSGYHLPDSDSDVDDLTDLEKSWLAK